MYWELLSILGKDARVLDLKDYVKVVVENITSIWDKIVDYCGDIAILNYSKQGDLVEILIACSSKSGFIKLYGRASSIDLLILSPLFLLYERPRVDEFALYSNL